MRQSQEGRALRQFTLSTGKSAGSNSSGKTKRSGLFKRMGGAPFSLGMEVYFLYLRRRWIRAIISFLFFTYFLFLRVVVPSLTLLKGLLFFPSCVIALPGATEPLIIEGLTLLNHYLSLREQDPEWIHWVQTELNERKELRTPSSFREFLVFSLWRKAR